MKIFCTISDPREETNPCCQAGRRFAFQFGQTGLLRASDCYTEGQKLQKLIKSSKCAKAFYRCCKSYEDRLSDAQSMQPDGMLENRGDFFDFGKCNNPFERHTCVYIFNLFN